MDIYLNQDDFKRLYVGLLTVTFDYRSFYDHFV